MSNVATRAPSGSDTTTFGAVGTVVASVFSESLWQPHPTNAVAVSIEAKATAIIFLSSHTPPFYILNDYLIF